MMTQIRTMGPTEARLLNRLAANGHIIFTTDQARAVLNTDDQDINKILYQLTHKRWLLRLEKGEGEEDFIAMLQEMGKQLWNAYCAFAPGAVAPLQSLLNHFREEVEEHIRRKKCPFK